MTGVSGFFDRQREERPRASVYFRDTDPRPLDPPPLPEPRVIAQSMFDLRAEIDRRERTIARAEDERLIDSLALFLADRLSTEVIDDPNSHNAIAALIRSWRDGRR